MGQIPILTGIYVDTTAEFRSSYPRNLVPVPKDTGISHGYLKQPEGLITFSANTPGVDRGGINWNGVCYRVMGSKLCSIDVNGNFLVLGDVGNQSGKFVVLNYSFDRLAILSDGNFFYYFNNILTQVISPYLITAIDFTWIDGYFFLTDGNSLIVTTLADPTIINPLSYGSSEVSPDPIKGVTKIRNEIYAVNRYTIEIFQDIGGTNLFPFQRVDGAQVTRGAVGTFAFCAFRSTNYYGQDTDALAFVGSGTDEPISVWVAINGLSTKIATREVDTILQNYTEAQLSQILVETRIEKSHNFLYIHLPDQTLVFDNTASNIGKAPVWFTLDSGLGPISAYKLRNLTWCYNRWIFGDPTTNQLGTFSQNVSSHFGNHVTWQIVTMIIYNAGNGAEIHELELISLTGSVAQGDDPTIWTSYSTDGLTWSNERPRSAGKIGNRLQRINWVQLGNMRNFRIQKFRGSSAAHIAIAALEARIEPLND